MRRFEASKRLHEMFLRHREMTSLAPPWIYETVVPVGQDLGVSIKQLGLADMPARVSRRPDSGALTIEVPLSERVESFGTNDDFVHAVERLAEREDDRKLIPEDRGAARHGAELGGFRTTFDALDVVGPGGRVYLSRYTDRLRAEIVIRKRAGRRVTRWRSADEVIKDVTARVSEAVDRIEIRHGYFEASKYDIQRWIRAAWVVLAEQKSSPDGPGRRYAIVVPSTTTGDLADGEGLAGMYKGAD